MSRQSAFIFDMDGTLVDSMLFHIQCPTDVNATVSFGS